MLGLLKTLTTAKCKKHQRVDEEKLKNIDNHSTK